MDVLVVHIGAGNQSLSRRSKYRRVIRDALNSGSLIEASKVLEGAEFTNTGYGSSLNMNGEVECDCSYMVARSAGGEAALVEEMGSMYNIRHRFPITETIESFRELGRIYENNQLGLSRPVTIDYGSVMQVLNKDNQTPHSLISPHSQNVYDRLKDYVLPFSGPQSEEPSGAVGEDLSHLAPVSDTIGVIHISQTDPAVPTTKTTVASSSGGNFFKLPGRIGCAGVLGSAIFHSALADSPYSITSMCSGNGENILMTQLAKTVVGGLFKRLVDESEDLSQDLVDIIVREAQGKPLAGSDVSNTSVERAIYVGVVCTIHNSDTGRTRLVYCHSTESFFFGFCRRAGSTAGEPEIILSTLESTAGVFCRGEFRI